MKLYFGEGKWGWALSCRSWCPAGINQIDGCSSPLKVVQAQSYIYLSLFFLLLFYYYFDLHISLVYKKRAESEIAAPGIPMSPASARRIREDLSIHISIPLQGADSQVQQGISICWWRRKGPSLDYFIFIHHTASKLWAQHAGTVGMSAIKSKGRGTFLPNYSECCFGISPARRLTTSCNSITRARYIPAKNNLDDGYRLMMWARGCKTGPPRERMTSQLIPDFTKCSVITITSNRSRLSYTFILKDSTTKNEPKRTLLTMTRTMVVVASKDDLILQ